MAKLANRCSTVARSDVKAANQVGERRGEISGAADAHGFGALALYVLRTRTLRALCIDHALLKKLRGTPPGVLVARVDLIEGWPVDTCGMDEEVDSNRVKLCG
jgi:hypothetical protein